MSDIFSHDGYTINRHYTTALTSRGDKVHILCGYSDNTNPEVRYTHLQCGSGDCTTGTKKRSGFMRYTGVVTCAKCLKAMENDPEMQAAMVAQAQRNFWNELARFMLRYPHLVTAY